jgi:O-antigen/teichoic acid export membrane protein
MKLRHATEAAWVIGGQAMAAAGTLAGVRLLTQLLPPAVYGAVTLALGISALVMGTAATPLSQAALHFYPGFAARGALRELRGSLRRCLTTVVLKGSLLVFIAAAMFVALGKGSPLFAALLIALIVVDSWRAVHLSILNAGRRQGRFALWSALDAWARPSLACAAVMIFSASAEWVLAAQAMAGLALLILFGSGTWGGMMERSTTSPADFEQRLWAYALPLAPLGLIAWASNLGDRYLIGGTLGLGQAGIYAAVYGLSSMPFMAVGGTIEQAARPVYQALVTGGHRARAREVLGMWFIAIAAICGAGLLMAVFWNQQLANLILGPAYRNAAALIPWIAAGYTLRCLSYVFERVCYANGDTRQVLVIQSCGAFATLIATPVGALNWGLQGAAVAVPICFGAQLAAAAILARKSLAQSHPVLSNTSVA